MSIFLNRGEKVRIEKSEKDQELDKHESYISFLETSLVELTKYANQMGTVEKEQSDALLDLSSNLNKISNTFSKESIN